MYLSTLRRLIEAMGGSLGLDTSEHPRNLKYPDGELALWNRR